MSAINRTTLVDSYLETMNVQNRKRSKSKGQKASQSIIIEKDSKTETSLLRSSLLFKTSGAGFDGNKCP
jgi:hypothetical protein